MASAGIFDGSDPEDPQNWWVQANKAYLITHVLPLKPFLNRSTNRFFFADGETSANVSSGFKLPCPVAAGGVDGLLGSGRKPISVTFSVVSAASEPGGLSFVQATLPINAACSLQTCRWFLKMAGLCLPVSFPIMAQDSKSVCQACLHHSA